MDSQIMPMSEQLPRRTRRVGELSYKFQRLRERLRQAIVSGELTGKLPGERQLAKRYNCNAKTLSKALTDLAAEGLLDRAIGRGTFVRGSRPPEEARGPWLILGQGDPAESALLQQFLVHNPRCQLVVGEPMQRPSFVNQFSGVIDLSASTPEGLVRDLVVRGVPVVVVGQEPRTYSVDCVLIDVLAGVTRLVRELVGLGHRSFAAVERPGRHAIGAALRQALAGREGMGSVETVAPGEVLAAASAGVTALVCESSEAADEAVRRLGEAGLGVPERMSVSAVGWAGHNPTVTGYYVSLAEVVNNVVRMLGEGQSRRPATLWLAPALTLRGTLAGPPGLPAGVIEGATEGVTAGVTGGVLGSGQLPLRGLRSGG